MQCKLENYYKKKQIKFLDQAEASENTRISAVVIIIIVVIVIVAV